ncbi:MAG: hypothetical protein HN509_12315 [Halobacteriovoraceae bacterium]|jgi:hypothetical protein|nr:hypothetical protein [Halobacteriovoraceae bacterium]MBT5095380.1 hypothetical protein [Halobacteriovoraceae bacterium]
MAGENKTSSIAVESTQTVAKKDQAMFPTWALMVGLVIALVVLKAFIYIKDKKRHGK